MPNIATAYTKLPVWPKCEQMLGGGASPQEVAKFIQDSGFMTDRKPFSVTAAVRRWRDTHMAIPTASVPAAEMFEGVLEKVDELEEFTKLINDQRERIATLERQEKESKTLLKQRGVEMTRLSAMLATFARTKKILGLAEPLPDEDPDDEDWDEDEEAEFLSDVSKKEEIRRGLI